jgi:bifunctional DNA-binding transcriptional regulator/antitoxin component of YhaV-PrlF toxin-antitoxin module
MRLCLTRLVTLSRVASEVWRFRGVPLMERVDFKAVLQKGNRVQLPKLVRWGYKLESRQVLKVTVTLVGAWAGIETFYGRMDKSGRITIPKLTLKQLLSRRPDIQSLTGAVLEVRLEPA